MSYGRDYRNTPAGPGSVLEAIRNVFRSGPVGSWLPRGKVEAFAQNDGTGIGIENIRRGYAKAVVGPLGSSINVTSTSWAPLSTPLKMEMVLSGRPLEVVVAGLWEGGTASNLLGDVLLRGVSITKNANGIAFINESPNAVSFVAYEVVDAPASGPATIEFVAKTSSNPGLIYADANNRIVLTAKEV
jgi:hypothetical protein